MTPERIAEDSDQGATSVYLQEIIQHTAKYESSRGIVFYLPETLSAPRHASYSTLHKLAKQNSITVRSLEGFKENRAILLYLEDQWDTIVWFWSVVLANGLPVLSSPLSNVHEQRQNYIEGLSRLLDSPICITREENMSSLYGRQSFQIQCVEWLSSERISYDTTDSDDSAPDNYSIRTNPTAPSVLMLTSGSTGSPKAVCLTHKQILASIRGKASVRPLPAGRAFLNWIDLGHVASLVEIHLQAMWLGVDQIHVSPVAMSSPILFLDLLSRHSVSRSFAPNFFLAKLVSSVDAESNPDRWDLSNLTVLASGGELNDVKTCLAASAILERYGAPRNVITTGFGMTETCAGAIFNLQCPESDVAKGHSVASLGKCMEGIEMRVTVKNAESNVTTGTSRIAKPDESGDLELRGEVVFKSYYRNVAATTDAFTADGWFRTGDLASIDLEGNLHLVGRVKDIFNINGIKFAAYDIQASVEQAIGERVARVICFPSRAVHTEQITVAYIAREKTRTPSYMAEIEELADQACMLSTGSRPLVFLLRDDSLSKLPISALGKISRAKMVSLFQNGAFVEDLLVYRQIMDKFREENRASSTMTVQAATPAEQLLMEDFVEALGITPNMVGLDTRIFDLGSTSMGIMRLKRHIDRRLKMAVPIIMLLKNPTPRSLAVSLGLNLQAQTSPFQSKQEAMQPTVTSPSVEYEPVVTFWSSGTKTPLWLIHPGVGEVIVFVGLAQHLRHDDRPVYALRARGFEANQEIFASIDETVDTYVRAILERQPHGPYAIAGYSYGTMLAFEVAKKLNAADEGTVQFLGSFNLPPHIKTRMRHLNWNICLLHLSMFLDLTSDEFTDSVDEHSFRKETRGHALKTILDSANQQRLDELGLGELELVRWTNVAFGLQSMAVDYEPSGNVEGIDVFHAIPLKTAAASEQEWIEEHLSRWSDFSRSTRFHHVGGTHYTMIGPEHVLSFSNKLIAALRSRGL